MSCNRAFDLWRPTSCVIWVIATAISVLVCHNARCDGCGVRLSLSTACSEPSNPYRLGVMSGDCLISIGPHGDIILEMSCPDGEKRVREAEMNIEMVKFV